MMNSITSLLDFAKTSAALARNNDNNNTNDNAVSASTTSRPSLGPYDLPEAMAAHPIPSTLTNINIKKAAAAVPLKKRCTGVKHKAPTPKTQQQEQQRQQNTNKDSSKDNKTKKPRRAIPENKEYIPENEQPTDADVVGGRGGRSNHHAGNRPYWIKILGSRFHYRTCQSDTAKTAIAKDILDFIKVDKGGRFLNLDSKTNRWFVLPDAVVLDKIKQALRDKYIPFWAKNMNIPVLPPGGISAASMMEGNNSWNTNNNSSFGQSMGAMSNQLKKPDDGNKLGFLLSAGRAAAANSSMAAIPTMDDALKCKIDATFGQGSGRSNPTANSGGSSAPTPFAFPGVARNGGGAASNASLGMGMFHSVHNVNLLASMASLGGGNGGDASGGVSHGFGVGGNSGAPSLGGGGVPPPYSSSAAAAGSLFNSTGLQSSDLERLFGNSSKMVDGAKSVDLLQSLAGTGGGMPSLGSLGAISFGLPDSLTAAAAAGGGDKGSTSSAPTGAASTTTTTTGAKKTDWNAMFKTALKKEEV